jgi:hypothetical protein
MSEFARQIFALPPQTHRPVDQGTVHAGPVVDHDDSGEAAIGRQEPDGHLRGESVDAVVHEVSHGGFERVVGPEALDECGVGRHGQVADDVGSRIRFVAHIHHDCPSHHSI